MNTRTILIASFAALAMTAGVPGVAATPSGNQSGGAGMMQQAQDSGQGRSMMQNMMQSGESDTMMGSGMMGGGTTDGGAMGMNGAGTKFHHGMRHGGMMGMMSGGMMGGGMMGMMGASCPMMSNMGLDRKTAMQMHGEMMQAIGKILVKYADKIQEPAVGQ